MTTHISSKLRATTKATGCILAALVLAGCATPMSKIANKIGLGNASEKRDTVVTPLPSDPAVRGSAAYAEEFANKQTKPKVMRMSSRSWVGAVMMPANSDDKLPASFSAEYVMAFADGRNNIPLSVVLSRMSQMVGIPARIAQDVYVSPSSASGGAAAPAATPAAASGADAVQALATATSASPPVAPRPSGGPGSATPMVLNLPAASLNWRGSLTGFLDHITDQLGLSWEYRDGAIHIMRFSTAMYELATFPNGYEYSINSGSAGNTTGEGITSSSQLNVAEQGNINGLSSLINVVRKMVESVPGSEVIVADGSGRLIVKTSRDVQASVREFIRAENNNMLKQVQIQMDIYSVNTSANNELGVDWSAFYRSLSNSFSIGAISPTTLTSQNAGAISATIIPAVPGSASETARRFGDSRIVINALNQIGNNVQHRPISLIALNRQWARKARLNTTGFLSETKPAAASALGGAGLPGLTTSSITTGDQYAVMPFILENNTVMLKMALSLSDLQGLFEVTTGSGETLQRVQTPNTSAISDQYTIALKPGEVMAITGLSRDVTMADQRTLGEGVSMGFGGSRTSSTMRENFVVFVRAIIM